MLSKSEHRSCAVEGCVNAPEGRRRLCTSHHRARRITGSPKGTIHRDRRADRGEALRYFEQVVRHYEGDECLIWPFAKPDGYATLVRKDSDTRLVSRMVCEETHGPAPSEEHQAAHSCGKGHLGCVAKKHIRWRTPAENQQERVEHGTASRGERSPLAKITEADVRQIRALRGVMSQREIGEVFGIKQAAVSKIHLRQVWGWLQ